MRRVTVLIALLSLSSAAPTVAQYFGQNKVQYRHLDFAMSVWLFRH